MKDLTMKPDLSYAVVEITVEIQTQAWGPECTIEQAVDQATRDATDKLRNALSQHGGIRVLKAKAVRVICRARAALGEKP